MAEGKNDAIAWKQIFTGYVWLTFDFMARSSGSHTFKLCGLESVTWPSPDPVKQGKQYIFREILELTEIAHWKVFNREPGP
jgi:hypothetical protein